MKKILLMLAMLLPCVGAWAEVEPLKVSTDAQKYYYVIKNARSNKYATFAGENRQLTQIAEPTTESYWYVTAEGENYKLRNAATNKVYAAYNSFTQAGATVYIKENPHRAGYYCVSLNQNLSANCWDDQGGHASIGYFAPTATDNQGTSWSFIEADADSKVCNYQITDDAGTVYAGDLEYIEYNGNIPLPMFAFAPAVKNVNNIAWNGNTVTGNISFPFPVSNAEVANPTLIVNGASWGSPNSRKWRAVEVEGVNYVKIQTSTVSSTNTDALWAIIPVLDNNSFKFEIKSLKTNTFVKASTEVAGNSNDVQGISKPVTLEAEGTAFEYKVRTGSNYHFAYTNTAGTELHPSMNSSGNTDVFLGVYSGGHSGNDIAFPDYVTEFDFPFTVSSTRSVNPIMIASFSDKAYTWHAEGSNIKVTKNVAATNENITTHLWTIYPVFSNEGCKYQIKNLGTGSYVYSTSSANSHNEGAVTLSETGTLFSFESNRFKLSTGKYLSLNSTSGTDGSTQTVGTWGGHGGCNIAFPTATYTLTVGDTRYASLYTLFAGTFAGEVKTYAIESASSNSATLEEKTGVAANQGAIIEANPGTYTFTAGAVISDWSNNQLKGSAVNSYVEGDAYVLALEGSKAVLTLAELNKQGNGSEGNTHFLNNAGKAYLPASAVVAGARTLFFGGSTTDIEDSTLAPVFNANAPIYDLSGRRVMNAVKGGIYIQNGKKFIVK